MKVLVGGKGWMLAVAVAISLAATAGVAAGLSGADALKDRQTHMKGMGAAAKALVDQVKSDNPDMGVIKDAAGKLNAGAQALPNWFPGGSGPETGLKTAALPVIWTDQADFAAAAKNLAAETAKLNTVAQAGDLPAVKADTMAVGGACGACHKKFRAKES
ncbi:MAG: c-type cytochrome [Caulobacterales bacterium]